MPKISGRIAPQISSAALLQSWENRYGHEIAPQANLQTDGSSFLITYSGSWNVESLKQSFEIEVHRVYPTATVTWS